MHIRYSSTYGSTKAYAQQLAERLGTEALDCTHPIEGDGPVIVLGPVHGPKMPALQYVERHHLHKRTLAVVAVGMTDPAIAAEKDQMRHHLPEHVARFYVPGRLFYSELSHKHLNIMRSVVALLKAKPLKSPAEKALIAGFGKDIDHTDKAALEPIVRWATNA
ncbi:flavodoxin domain-containing protein [Corynebacterium pseudopelargi]|uniref:Flavodoxin domain protein n=1 Tax=Corynebacterium pseudopelargi TaxID=2080757 RepID=A0A3G6J0C9_9CORY|nr:flavodoxin domain-containing protein [Corynebacterium pseudopelargi]AZA09604.1 Flavodoxin domain protein [Corynebacterium pseudopelargi]